MGDAFLKKEWHHLTKRRAEQVASSCYAQTAQVRKIRKKKVGNIGGITHRGKHPGSFKIVHIKDAVWHAFNTRLENVFVIGKGNKPS